MSALTRYLGSGVAAAAWPLAARAQPTGAVWRIGFLTPRSHPSPTGRDAFSDAFIDGMRKLGYNEGKNLIVEWRYAAGDYPRLGGFAHELVGMNLPVIVTYGTAAARVLACDAHAVQPFILPQVMATLI